MAFCGKHPVHSKIVTQDNTLEQVSDFNCLGCDVRYDYGRDTEGEINSNKFVGELTKHWVQKHEEILGSNSVA